MPTRPSLPPPESIGPYRVISRLAAGGMAEVFLAVRRGAAGFERPIVVKRMLPHLASDPELRSAIVDEARIISRLQHPNVVSIDELAIDGATYYLVLEYVRGESVSALLRRLRATGEQLDPGIVAYVVGEICAGLHAAHELTDDDDAPLGVVHRDVSPQNVLVTYHGEVKVIDFGIARFSHRAAARTKTGVAKGKFAYMAPEQFSGEPIDRRADVFAVGTLMYELLTGERLFARESDVQVLKAILEDDVVPPSQRCPALPTALDDVCLRALARPRDERFPTADALRLALRDLMPTLDPGHDARDRLVAIMRRVLADRWAESDDLVRRSRERSSTRPNPTRALCDVSRRTPTPSEPSGSPALPLELEVAIETGSGTPSVAHDRAPAAVGRWVRPALAVGLGAAAIAGGVLVAALMGPGGVAAPATAPSVGAPPLAHLPAPAPAPLREIPGPVAEPEPAPMVRVHLETAPEGAEVLAGGRLLGTTPCDVELRRGREPVRLTLARAGFAPASETIVPAADARVRVHLTRAREPEPDSPDTPRFYSFD